MDPVFQLFRGKFIEETTELLDLLEKGLLDLEQNPCDKEQIESVFRAMHTIKGISGMYGFDFICEITHTMESIYQLIRDNATRFDKDVFDVTFLSIDHIRKLLSDEKLAVEENRTNHQLLLKSIEIILSRVENTPIPEEGEAYQIYEEENDLSSTWHIILRANEHIHFRGISLMSIFMDLAKIGKYELTRLDYLSSADMDTWSIILYTTCTASEVMDVFMFIEDDCTITRLSGRNLFEDYEMGQKKGDEPTILDYVESFEKGVQIKEELKQGVITSDGSAEREFIPFSINKKGIKRLSVDSEKLDHLMYLVSELITLNSQFGLVTAGQGFDKVLPFTERLDNLSKLFRNNVLAIRLVPLSETILRFKRLIRDLSIQLGKEVSLVTEGIDTELDKGTVDQLGDPLMHIIRNCIDHGIEFPDERVDKGKPSTGVIRINASHSGNFVIIKVEDDGMGIDLEKIKEKAIAKGIIKVGDQPTREELLELIFLPGFSTARNLTEVSGRGVGMDVVRRKIAELRGEVIIDTEPGKGTTFTLKLQQSVAIVDTLLFRVGNAFFTVAISDIDICLQVQRHDVERHDHTRTLPFEDKLIPFVNVRECFALDGSYEALIKAVVIKSGSRQLALLTDTIIGEHQAVLKPLGHLLSGQKCISAASQLGDGRLAFMIDTNELFSRIENTLN